MIEIHPIAMEKINHAGFDLDPSGLQYGGGEGAQDASAPWLLVERGEEDFYSFYPTRDQAVQSIGEAVQEGSRNFHDYHFFLITGDEVEWVTALRVEAVSQPL